MEAAAQQSTASSLHQSVIASARDNSSNGSDSSTDSGDELREAGDIEIGLEGTLSSLNMGDIGESGTVFSPPAGGSSSGMAAIMQGGQKPSTVTQAKLDEDDGSDDEGVQIKTTTRMGGSSTS
jgi:hypothetical protein